MPEIFSQENPKINFSQRIASKFSSVGIHSSLEYVRLMQNGFSLPGGSPTDEIENPQRTRRLESVRVLIYSHDTFGLGHLRRCQAIAHALVDRFKGLHVLIISGSPIASSFEFRARVDFVKIPSVIKNYNGEYTSLDRHIDLTETLALRRSIILHTAMSFDPDIFIVDKEPLGLRGEVEETLG